jgi:hypothetical protein
LRAGGEVSEDLSLRVRQWRVDLNMAVRLEEINLDTAPDGHDQRNADRLYREEFRRYGLDVDTLDPTEAASRIAQSPIATQLVAALDNWVLARHVPDQARRLTAFDQKLLTIARRADPDLFRDRLRQALQQGDEKAFSDLNLSRTSRRAPSQSALAGRNAESSPASRVAFRAVLSFSARPND